MKQWIEKRNSNLIIIGFFIILLYIQIMLLDSGVAWIRVDVIQFDFWMFVFVFIVATVTGIVSTYSFVQYTQERCFRCLVFTLIGINVVLLAFLFLLTHPAAIWSAFSNRQRNMTIVALLGFLITPGTLVGLIVDKRTITRKSRNTFLLWGLVAQPIASLWMFFSPEPVFTLSDPDGMVFSLTIYGLLFAIIIGITFFVSLALYLHEWIKDRESVILATTLALVLWVLSYLLYIVIDDPLQIAELMWLGDLASGFTLIAIAMATTAIIEPHRALEFLVRERTTQLDESRKESEFYLHLWTHKIGNLLQGIVSYLELIGYKVKEKEDISDLNKPAFDLVRESILVNRQVERLIRIKEQIDGIKWPVNLGYIMKKSINEAKEDIGDVTIDIKSQLFDHGLQIIADDLVDIVFVNLIIKCAKQRLNCNSKISIDVIQTSKAIQVIFSPCKVFLQTDMRAWFTSKSSLKNGTLDLDLFMVSLLMERYGGKIEILEDSETRNNELVLTFRRP